MFSTKKILGVLNKTKITMGVAIKCAAIGAVEGYLSGSTGAWIKGYDWQFNGALAAAGISGLGFIEGIGMGAAAVCLYNKFSNYETMKKFGWDSSHVKRVTGNVGYIANQIAGGALASLFIGNPDNIQLITSVAIGAAIWSNVITPTVTHVATRLLENAYGEAKKIEENPCPEVQVDVQSVTSSYQRM